jgi:hypothetical protein
MRHPGFNPKARWDRRIPQTDTTPAEDLSEKIDVCAWFRAGKIMPHRFCWNDKEYPIEKINYAWKERLGQEVISYFSVDTGANQYQISFNNTSFGWRLEKIIT